MYGLLTKVMGPKVAGILCALWFSGLLLAILYFSAEAPADFRYGRY